MTLANWITLSRIAAVPLVVILLPRDPWLAVITFCIISFTDFLDGFVARKMNQETTLGKFLDPLADKILVITLLLFFVGATRISYISVAIIVVRELAVSALRTFAALEKQIIKADQLGKTKTIFQYVTIIWLMLSLPAENIFIQIMVILTVISGANYFWVNRKVFKHG